MRFRVLRSLCLIGLLAGITLTPRVGAQQDFNFAITEEFLKSLAADNSVLTTINIRLDARSDMHGLAADCEMHIGGVPTSVTLGAPKAIVVEPPNLCKIAPDGTMPTRGLSTKWYNLFDSEVIKKRCDVTGFFRIFTEHAKGGGASNPDHVFEIHPATSIDCGREISFGGMLKVFTGMSAIKPKTANSCFEKRRLEVRFKNSRYEFRQSGGMCGNFAIIQVNAAAQNNVSKVRGGHSALVDVTADGVNNRSLRIYTLAGSDADDWLAEVNSSGMGADPVMLHGIITYDYRAIIRTVRGAGREWLRPTEWTQIASPIALVILGRTETVPWRRRR